MFISDCPIFQQGDKRMRRCLENMIRIRCGKLSLLRKMEKSVTRLEKKAIGGVLEVHENILPYF